MNSSSIVRHFNEEPIRFDPSNNFVNLTDMAKATRKKVNDFLRLDNTQEFIGELSFATGIPAANLLHVGDKSTGSWGHPQLAIKFAAWLSAKFEVLMTSWIFELLTTGKVEINPQTHQSALPEAEFDRVNNMASTVAKPKPCKEPRDEITLPGWSQIRELITKYCKDDSLANNSRFRHFISRQFADIYRGLFGDEPPRVTRGKHKGYCYPPSFAGLVDDYISRWMTTQAQLPPAA
jgi:KilA-N domain